MAGSTVAPRIDHHPLDYETETFQKGLQYKKPPITFDSTRWATEAKAILPATARNYVEGSAGTGTTDEDNVAAFRKWAFVPRRLTGQQKFPDLSVEMFGEKFPYPVGIGPVGVQKIFHPDGEIATTRAAAAAEVPYTFSSASATSIEEVAVANGAGKRWFQLYWPANSNNDITASLLSRAQDNGYSVLMINVDTFIVGWRPHDMDAGYSPFIRPDRIGVEMGFTDPVFRAKFKQSTGKEVEEDMSLAAISWTKTFTAGFPHAWEDLKWIRSHWKGKIILKGIQCAEDALLSIENGMDGIVVSNHGGREVDGNVASLAVLPEIADAVGGRIPVLFDSGIRTGTDVLKALALGADFCLIGRPWVYGLALGGQDGVSHVIKSILGELQLNLHLQGLSSVAKSELNRSVLRKVD